MHSSPLLRVCLCGCCCCCSPVHKCDWYSSHFTIALANVSCHSTSIFARFWLLLLLNNLHKKLKFPFLLIFDSVKMKYAINDCACIRVGEYSVCVCVCSERRNTSGFTEAKKNIIYIKIGFLKNVHAVEQKNETKRKRKENG